MATRFELLLHGDNPVSLRAAGEEALDEVDRIEARLSLYRATSEIARVNALASREKVRVSPETFSLLKHARKLSEETKGAFDITIAPLVRCWGFMGGTGRLPSAEEIAEARGKTGFELLELDERESTVRFRFDGVMIDLGAIGKGYALDVAVESLREAGVVSAFLHGGTSTVCCIGKPMDAETWKVALEYPKLENSPVADKPLAVIPLKDEALSVSGVWGRAIRHEGKLLGHVIDPRTGQPVTNAVMSSVILASATESDALSTALLVAGEKEHAAINALRPGMKSVVLKEDAAHKSGFRISGIGIEGGA